MSDMLVTNHALIPMSCGNFTRVIFHASAATLLLLMIITTNLFALLHVAQSCHKLNGSCSLIPLIPLYFIVLVNDAAT